VKGRYASKGWTEWTQGFVYGSALLQFDATQDSEFLALGREHTFKDMAGHVTHFGVHDHGFNNVSTYGNLWRMLGEGRFKAEGREQDFYEMALKASGALDPRRRRQGLHPFLQRAAFPLRRYHPLPPRAGLGA
jgi:hypothetical protein